MKINMFDWILGYALIQIPDLLLIAYDYLQKRRITDQACRAATTSKTQSQFDVASNFGLKLRNSTEPITQRHHICKVAPKEAHFRDEEVIKVSDEQKIHDILDNERDRRIAAQSNQGCLQSRREAL